jgi:hypothetical protein
MYNYCTLFDSNYLTRGLAMYQSLKKHSDHFHLYIFAFDDTSYHLLKKIDWEFMTIIPLQAFEDGELLKVKEDRSSGEYCWTCTPSIIKYSIEKYGLDSCTYLDADLYFYSDPSVLIEEMENKSVLITEHRYTPQYDQSATCGIYCVQFMTFKNDAKGMKVLNWWRNACIEWCYARFENGKFGDQKYLDDWVTKFGGVHELCHFGAVAPWNIQQYDIRMEESGLFGLELKTYNTFKVIFYHFHAVRFVEKNRIELGIYKFKKRDIELLYKPYIKHLAKITNYLRSFDKNNDYNGVVEKDPFHWKDPLRYVKRKVIGNYNRYEIKDLMR